jgi:hypothetical protein
MTFKNGTNAVSELRSSLTRNAMKKPVNHLADIEVGENIKVQIMKDLIEPMYISDVKSAIKEKRCWKVTGQVFETLSKVLVAVGGIISFSSGYYSNPTLGFVAGSVSTVSLAMLQFSSFSYGQNKKQSSELNILLTKLDIDTVPELSREVLFKSDDDSKTMDATDSKDGREEKTVNYSTMIEKDTNEHHQDQIVL